MLINISKWKLDITRARVALVYDVVTNVLTDRCCSTGPAGTRRDEGECVVNSKMLLSILRTYYDNVPLSSFSTSIVILFFYNNNNIECGVRSTTLYSPLYSTLCAQGAQGEPGSKGERGDPGLPVRKLSLQCYLYLLVAYLLLRHSLRLCYH